VKPKRDPSDGKSRSNSDGESDAGIADSSS
jgi:hypothetical protein